MKSILPLPLLATLALAAVPLDRDATVHVAPDPSSAALGTLARGTVPEPAPEGTPQTDGWQAVALPGPHEVYVLNRDIGKELEIKPGAALYAAPDREAPVVARMEKGDKADLRGLRGEWTLYRIDKPLVGYVKLPGAAPAVAAAPLPVPLSVINAAPGVDPGTGGIPRFFAGRFAATRGFVGFRHPYNFQLLDGAGDRFAYLDVSRLLLTDQIDRYLDRLVIVYGTARRLEGKERPGGIVIEVESLHLK